MRGCSGTAGVTGAVTPPVTPDPEPVTGCHGILRRTGSSRYRHSCSRHRPSPPGFGPRSRGLWTTFRAGSRCQVSIPSVAVRSVARDRPSVPRDLARSSSRGRGALSGYWSAGGMFSSGGRRVGDPPMVRRTDLFGRSCLADVAPECRCNVTRKVTDVRRGDDPVCRPDGRDSGCENDVAIERPVVGSRLAPLTSVRPERGCLPHRRSRERQVLSEVDDRIEPSESLLPATPQQLAAYFVICDLRQDDTRAGCDERPKPLGTSQALRRSLRVRHQTQRPGVECDHQTHQVTPLCSVGNN